MQAIRRALFTVAPLITLCAGSAWADFTGQDSTGAARTFKSDDAGGTTIPVHELSASTAVIGHVIVDTAPTTAVTGTFWQATQPVSAASLPLPSGAATAAKQPTLGTAGTPSADVITVQGVTSMTALKTDPSGVTSPVSIASLPALPANQSINAAQINGVAPSMGNGVSGTGVQRVTLASDGTGVVAATQSGTWNVTNVSGTVSLPTGAATAAKQPALGTAGTASADVISVQGVAGQTPIPVVKTANPTSTMTRPANTTPYANLQLVASNTTPGSVVVSSFAAPATAACSFDLAVLKLSWNNTGTGPGTGLDGWALTARLWSSAPTYVNGDGGAYRVATNGATLLGVYTCSLTQYDDAATGFCQAVGGFPISVKLASGTTVYWDLQSNGAITPQSGKVATLTPYLKQDTC